MTTNRFLQASYEMLDYQNGALLQAVSHPVSDTLANEWTDKGEWLALAKEVGAERVFFVHNDPVIVFCDCTERSSVVQQLEIFRRSWCMARPQFLFMAFTDELRVYDLNKAPAKDADEWIEREPLGIVQRLEETLDKLADFRREQVETGRLFGDKRFEGADQRADKQLITDLKALRRELRSINDLEIKFAHALIGRAIFVRYLEDRNILAPEYFEQIASEREDWRLILAEQPEKPLLTLGQEQRRFDRVLRNKDFTYALFHRLAKDFNGDMFPRDEEEESLVTLEHLLAIRRFLLGDTSKEQQNMFFWAYDFKVVPIELISNIYEEFYHNTTDEDNGTHYTPSVLVEYVLSQTLTVERLRESPRILDPSCGSGIFLVEAFRRIVRFRVQQERRLLTPIELRSIIRDQLTGIEINGEAARIAAFSLYLALLHYQEPPDILHHPRLPKLIFQEGVDTDDDHYQVIHVANAFGLTAEETKEINDAVKQTSVMKRMLAASQHLYLGLNSFDVIIGNPPWVEVGSTIRSVYSNDLPGKSYLFRPFHYDKEQHSLSISDELLPTHIARAQGLWPVKYQPLLSELNRYSDEGFQALRWARSRDLVVGEGSYSQLFIYRALSLVKSTGVVGLLVHSNVIYNQRSTSKQFRQAWLTKAVLHQVVNFAHVRRLFFTEAVAPFLFVSFSPSHDGEYQSARFKYISARRTKTAERLRSVILSKSDLRVVRQSDFLYRDYLWKTYWWGSHRDAALLAALDLEPKLSDIISSGTPEPGYGFQRGSNEPSDTLLSLRPLSSRGLRWYGPLREDWFENKPTGVGRQPDERLYFGQRLLVVRGVKSETGVCVRLEYDNFSFRHTIYSIPLPQLPPWKAKVILGILWSRLGQYRLFMTSGSWGTWYDQTVPEDVLSMPIRFPRRPTVTTNRLVKVVDEIRAWNPTSLGPLFGANEPSATPPTSLINNLDEAVFDLFELTSAQRDLIGDFANYNFNLFSEGPDSKALAPVQTFLPISSGTIEDLKKPFMDGEELGTYLKVLLGIWNRELDKAGEFGWQVIRSNDATMLGVVLTTRGENGLEKSHSESNTNWEQLLAHCTEALLYPVSRKVYIEGMIRVVTPTTIVVIKRNECRLWTKTAAREDAEATVVQAMQLYNQVTLGK